VIDDGELVLFPLRLEFGKGCTGVQGQALIALVELGQIDDEGASCLPCSRAILVDATARLYKNASSGTPTLRARFRHYAVVSRSYRKG
ncbi:MAG: hypothetical protein ACRYG8_35830, partial [Janthinobacterium lividum]